MNFYVKIKLHAIKYEPCIIHILLLPLFYVLSSRQGKCSVRKCRQRRESYALRSGWPAHPQAVILKSKLRKSLEIILGYLLKKVTAAIQFKIDIFSLAYRSCKEGFIACVVPLKKARMVIIMCSLSILSTRLQMT